MLRKLCVKTSQEGKRGSSSCLHDMHKKMQLRHVHPLNEKSLPKCHVRKQASIFGALQNILKELQGNLFLHACGYSPSQQADCPECHIRCLYFASLHLQTGKPLVGRVLVKKWRGSDARGRAGSSNLASFLRSCSLSKPNNSTDHSK